MQILKRLTDFYIFSNIHVAVAMFSFVKISLLAFEINENTTAFFVFFSTIISYNFIRTYKLNEIDLYSSAWIREHKKGLIILNLVSAFVLLYLTFQIELNSVLVLIPFIATTFFYIVPISEDKKNLRSVAGLKLFLIAVTGAGVTVLFPLSHNDIDFGNNVWLLFLQRFLFIIANTIPFDIRDMNDDHIHLKTLPQFYGINLSKIIGTVSLVFFFLLEFLKEPAEEISIVISAILSVITFIFLIFTKTDQSRYYTMFWVESLPILWFLMVLYL